MTTMKREETTVKLGESEKWAAGMLETKKNMEDARSAIRSLFSMVYDSEQALKKVAQKNLLSRCYF